MISADGNVVLAAVGLGDICRVLRENTTDLGSLCRSRAINKWAKYKPVSNTELEYEDELNATRDGWLETATWWRGTDGQCGIANITAYSAEQLTADTVAELFASCWVYNPPSGTSVSPYRAEDFLRYRRTAQSPFGKVTGYPSADLEYYQGSSVLRWVITPHTAESDELSLTDIGRSFAGEETTIAAMRFGMLFICIKTTSSTTGYLGRRLVKTCDAPIGSGGTVLELTTADTVKFGSDLGTDETRWIAYPVLIEGVAVAELTELAAMNAGNNLMFAPYREAVTEAAKPLRFLPSQYDVQSRLVGIGMGTGDTDNFYTFQLSIVNKTAETKTVDALSDVTLKLKYTTQAVTATAIDWSGVTTAYTSSLTDARSTAYGLTITRVTADNGITHTDLTGGWTVGAGESVTIEGRIIYSPTGDFPNMTHAQLSCAIRYSGDTDFTEYAAGQNSYWHKESDEQEVAKEQTHTATLEVVSTYLSGWQMNVRLRPVVTAKSGTGTVTWSAADLKITVGVQYGGSRTYYFPASTVGTWSGGVWTGDVMELTLTPSTGTSASEYVSWTIGSVHAIGGSAGNVTVER